MPLQLNGLSQSNNDNNYITNNKNYINSYVVKIATNSNSKLICLVDALPVPGTSRFSPSNGGFGDN